MVKFHRHVSITGWGNTGGTLETSTNELQETVVPIVQSSNCLGQSEGLDENLIVCAGNGQTGPCKVFFTNICFKLTHA